MMEKATVRIKVLLDSGNTITYKTYSDVTVNAVKSSNSIGSVVKDGWTGKLAKVVSVKEIKGYYL